MAAGLSSGTIKVYLGLYYFTKREIYEVLCNLESFVTLSRCFLSVWSKREGNTKCAMELDCTCYLEVSYIDITVELF